MLSLSARVARLRQPVARLPLVLIVLLQVALGLLYALAIRGRVVLAALELVAI